MKPDTFCPRVSFWFVYRSLIPPRFLLDESAMGKRLALYVAAGKLKPGKNRSTADGIMYNLIL